MCKVIQIHPTDTVAIALEAVAPNKIIQYLDDVFEFNFAFGPEGDKLKGKDFILSLTVGGPQESYIPIGYNHFSIDDLLKPLEQLSYLSQMIFHKPIRSHRMVYIPNVYNTKEAVLAKAKEHVTQLDNCIANIINNVVTTLTRFAYEWYEYYDKRDINYLGKRIHNDCDLDILGVKSKGISSFSSMIQEQSTKYKSISHQIDQVDVKQKNEQEYEVEIRTQATVISLDNVEQVCNARVNWIIEFEEALPQIRLYTVVII